MKNLKLSQGLIAIGAAQGVGKTSFSIRLANYLAQKEKVLFLNWTDYADKLHEILRNSEAEIHKNLDINTRIGYFNIGSFIDILERIDTQKYTTIFIDDLNYFTQTGDTYGELDQFNTYGKDSAIRALRFIVDKYKVRVVFNLTIDNVVTPKLADFAWSRLIINDCDQVIGLSNDQDGNQIEMYVLKDLKLEKESIN